jgi:hypothetical protein
MILNNGANVFLREKKTCEESSPQVFSLHFLSCSIIYSKSTHMMAQQKAPDARLAKAEE